MARRRRPRAMAKCRRLEEGKREEKAHRAATKNPRQIRSAELAGVGEDRRRQRRREAARFGRGGAPRLQLMGEDDEVEAGGARGQLGWTGQAPVAADRRRARRRRSGQRRRESERVLGERGEVVRRPGEMARGGLIPSPHQLCRGGERWPASRARRAR